jgi:DGQHR domain-containing protein
MKTKSIRVPALRITQGDGQHVYSFAMDGKDLDAIAGVARVRRDDDRAIEGYQRPEVIKHVAAIRSYIESDEAMVPNALVIAFDERVTWKSAARSSAQGLAESGTLTIPVSDDPDWVRPGWIVDGQQRAAALRDARVDNFPIFVSGFVTNSEQVQRSQFILVNSTKPLPKGLIHELLPSTRGTLPPSLRRKRFPALLLERLNYDEDSPLQGRIRTPTHPDGEAKDNSILKMLESSLTDGALYEYRDSKTGDGDIEAMLSILKPYWGAVRDVFGEAWGLPPRKSRLLHGVGIASLGFLMDTIVDEIREPDPSRFEEELGYVADACAWTSGHWVFPDGARRAWDEVQNTPKDIQLICAHLALEYRRKKLDSLDELLAL